MPFQLIRAERVDSCVLEMRDYLDSFTEDFWNLDSFIFIEGFKFPFFRVAFFVTYGEEELNPPGEAILYSIRKGRVNKESGLFSYEQYIPHE